MTIDERTLALIRDALAEDLGTGDATTDSTVPAEQVATGRIIAKEDGVLAGVPVAVAVFRELDPDVEVEAHVAEGARVTPGTLVATVRGRTRAILTGERTALNFLQRLSGVATLASRYAAAVEGTGVTILDTRKTTPGLRILEKYAVSLGGGGNHRMGLWDMALIKDNHIVAAGGIRPAVERVRERHPGLAIEVEVTGPSELREALDAGVGRIMLDNMTIAEMREAVAMARSHCPTPEIEVSGGVTLDEVRRIAETGPDFISVGALTHSAPALDISLDLEAKP